MPSFAALLTAALLMLPDPHLTPGAVRSTQIAVVCRPGYAKAVRKVSDATKRRLYTAYGLHPRHLPCPCVIDHLIPLSIGGSNAPANLWPQVVKGDWGAKVKDRLEARVRVLGCSGAVPLPTLQHAIATNWIEAYQTYTLPEPVHARP